MLFGSTGNDTLEGGEGNDRVDGGTGLDTASYTNSTAGVTISLALTSAQSTGGGGVDTLANIENLIGSAYADMLTGDSTANRLEGGAGNDRLEGGAGTDTAVFTGVLSEYDIQILDRRLPSVLGHNKLREQWHRHPDQHRVPAVFRSDRGHR